MMKRLLFTLSITIALVFNGCSSEEDSPTNPNLAGPTNLQAVVRSPTEVRVSWLDNSQTESGYFLERTAPNAEWAELATLPANTDIYDDHSVQEGGIYTYRVSSIEGRNRSTPAGPVTVAMPLINPINLAATTPAERSIRLNWTDRSHAEYGFEIERKGVGEEFVTLGWATEDTVTYLDTTVTPVGTFTYRVRAAQDSVFSSYSNEVEATVSFLPPAGFHAERRSIASIGLTWRDSSRIESFYNLERRIQSGPYARIVQLPANATSFIDSGLVANTTYFYRLRAEADGYFSEFSPEDSASTYSLIPAAPSDLVANSNSSAPNKVVLNWQDNSTTEIGFSVESAPQVLGPWRLIQEVAANIEQFSVNNLPSEAVFYYRISAYNLEGVSPHSNVATAEVVGIPPAPSELQGSAPDWRGARLDWRDNSRRELGFKIERNIPPSVEWARIASVLADETTYTDETTVQGVLYYYRVASYNDVGMSSFADSVQVTVPDGRPMPPSDLVAEAPHWNRVMLSWADHSNNEQGFELERRAPPQFEWGFLTRVGVDATAYIDSAVTPGANYLYRIHSFNEAGRSDDAPEASVQVPEERVPNAPSRLEVSPLAAHRARLVWRDNDTIEEEFLVERRDDGSDAWDEIASLPPNAIEYIDTTVTPVRSYFYRVSAWNEIGQSAYSNEARLQMPSVPATPTNLEANPIDADRIELSWIDRAHDETAYYVERRLTDGNDEFEMVAILGADEGRYMDTLLTPSTSYDYRIQCQGEVLPSEYSNIATAMTPSLGVFSDDFEDDVIGNQPGAPWNIVESGASTVRVADAQAIDGSRALEFQDPAGDQDNSNANFNHRDLIRGSVSLRLWLSNGGYFGVLAGDNSENTYITWQIQFNGDGSFYLRDGQRVLDGGEGPPREQWFTMEVRFDADSSRYQVFFNGNPAHDPVAIQRDDHAPAASVYFRTFSDVGIDHAWIDDVVVERVLPGGERFRGVPSVRPVAQQGTETIRDALRMVRVGVK
jgi:titin